MCGQLISKPATRLRQSRGTHKTRYDACHSSAGLYCGAGKHGASQAALDKAAWSSSAHAPCLQRPETEVQAVAATSNCQQQYQVPFWVVHCNSLQAYICRHG